MVAACRALSPSTLESWKPSLFSWLAGFPGPKQVNLVTCAQTGEDENSTAGGVFRALAGSCFCLGRSAWPNRSFPGNAILHARCHTGTRQLVQQHSRGLHHGSRKGKLQPSKEPATIRHRLHTCARRSFSKTCSATQLTKFRRRMTVPSKLARQSSRGKMQLWQ